MRGLARAAPIALTASALAALHGGCHSRSRPDGARLRVEYAGCGSVLNGPVCVPRPNRQLAVWISGPAEVPLRFVGAHAVGAPVLIQEGRRYALELEPATERLQVEVGGAAWALEIRDVKPPSWSREVGTLLQAGKFDEAQRLAQERMASGPAEEQGRALAALARIAMQRGRPDEAQALLRRAIADHRARGRVLDEIKDGAMLLFTLLNEARRLDEARAILASLPSGPTAPAEASYQIAYFRGLLALTTGDLRTALPQLDEAAQQAQRVGLDFFERTAELVRAEVLQVLGRREEADAVLERLLREAPKELPACQRAQLLTALGWNRLLVREVGDVTPDPVPVLEEALQALGGGCAELPAGELSLRLNLALAHLQNGQLRKARARLATGRPPTAPPLGLVLWQRELEARLDLAEGRPARALERYLELRRLADAALAWGTQWRAAAGRAQALRALGRKQPAVAAFAEAEELLDAESLQVPIQDGRDIFVAGRERVTRNYLDLLLSAGRTSEALALVRRSHSRVLAALVLGERLGSLPPDKRRVWDGAMSAYHRKRDELATSTAEDWKLSADRLRLVGAQREATRKSLAELLDGTLALVDRERGRRTTPRQPVAGEMMLAYHPLPVGEAGFAADAHGVRAVRLDCLAKNLPPAELGACLLGPFAAEIKGARQVTLLPVGALGNVDIHALPFEGGPLLAGRPVSWSLDLAGAGSAESHPPVALLVGDPRGDLPAARREMRSVEVALQAADHGWQLDSKEAERARDTEIRRTLPRADLFHFAGHAEFTGRGGWDSVLPLADSSGLTVADILALERAPRWVVLSGCETGRSSHRTGESLGLAQAFLARGSHAVVAATRPVADQTAAALVEGFYRSWSTGVSPAAALQRAQLGLQSADPQADWSAFRILER